MSELLARDLHPLAGLPPASLWSVFASHDYCSSTNSTNADLAPRYLHQKTNTQALHCHHLVELIDDCSLKEKQKRE